MKPEIKIHAPNLTRDIEAYLKTSSRTAAEVVNARAFFAMVNASRATSRANKDEILKLGLVELGKKEYVDKRSGKIRTRSKYDFAKDNAAVSNFVVAQAVLRKMKVDQVFAQYSSGAEILPLAKRWITRKIQSIGFLASTFKPIMDKFRRYGGGAIPTDLKRYKSIKSTSKAASPNEANPEVVLRAIVNDYGTGVGEKPQRLAAKAMSIGINMETSNLRKQTEKNLAASMDKLNRA